MEDLDFLEEEEIQKKAPEKRCPICAKPPVEESICPNCGQRGICRYHIYTYFIDNRKDLFLSIFFYHHIYLYIGGGIMFFKKNNQKVIIFGLNNISVLLIRELSLSRDIIIITEQFERGQDESIDAEIIVKK
ncbi:MAG: hypothetical protein ACLFQV_07135, partial [Vulcanimicrobiota bacterium]